MELRCVAVNCGSQGFKGSAHKVLALVEALGSSSVDVLFINETHLTPGKSLELPGYTVLVRHRVECEGKHKAGGVAVAVRCGQRSVVTAATVVNSCPLADVLVVQLQLDGVVKPVLVMSAYFPPDRANFCCDCLDDSCPKSNPDEGVQFIAAELRQRDVYAAVIVAGDMNAHAEALRGRQTARWRALQDGLTGDDVGLSVWNPRSQTGGYQPTHGRTAVLDMVYGWTANGATRVHCAVLRDSIRVSDHHPLQVVLQFQRDALLQADKPTDVPPLLLRRLRIPEGREQDVVAHVGAQLQGQQAVGTSSERYTRLVSAVAAACDRIPRSSRHPFLTVEDQASMKRRLRQLEKQRKCCRTAEQTERVRLAMRALMQEKKVKQRQWVRACREKEQREIQQHFEGDKPKTVALGIKRLQEAHLRVRSRRPAHGEVTAAEAEAKQQFLAGKYSHANTTPMLQEQVAQHREHHQQQHGSEWTVTTEEVLGALSSLSNSSAALGPSVTTIKALMADDGLRLAIVQLMQHILRTGDIPDEFRSVCVTALHKSGALDDFSNYRYVGTCEGLCRLFQAIVNRELTRFTLSNRLLSENQFGFVPNKSTLQAVYLANSAVACARLSGSTVYSVYLDLKGAFPTTSHDRILVELHNRGFASSVWRVLDSWFKGQSVFFRIGSTASPRISVLVGVTEGAVFSPILFNLVIDSLIRRLEQLSQAGIGIRTGDSNVITLWFADDGRIFTTMPEALQTALDVCSEWAVEYGFEYNVKAGKTSIAIGLPADQNKRRRAKLTAGDVKFTLSGKEVPVEPTYKYLGVYTASQGLHASRKAHMRYLANKIASLKHEACSSHLASQPLWVGRLLWKAYWFPAVTYGLDQIIVAPALCSHGSSIVCCRQCLATSRSHVLCCGRCMEHQPCTRSSICTDYGSWGTY